MADYKLSHTAEEVDELLTRVKNGSNGTVEDYLLNELGIVSDKLTELQLRHPKSMSFAFMTDLHFHYNNEHLLRHNLRVIDEIAKDHRIEFCAFGGDNLAENGNAEHQLQKMRYFAKVLSDYEIEKFLAKGNHDDNSLAGYDEAVQKYSLQSVVSDGGYYSACFKQNENKYNVTMDTNRDRLYYYVDLPTSRIRVIFLNCVDIPIIDDGEGYVVYDGIHQYGYSQEQISWVANEALDFSDVKRPEEWGVITVQHISDCPNIPAFANDIVPADHNGEIMCGVFKAFANKEAYNGANDNADFACSVACDFTNTKARLICRISGHTHKDYNIMADNVCYISTMQAADGCGDYASKDGVVYKKVPGTADESAFDIFTVDMDNETIYATRFGVGEDRILVYTTANDGNLFTYGISGSYDSETPTADYRATNDKGFQLIINSEEKWLRSNDVGGSAKALLRTVEYPNNGSSYRLSATFASTTGENPARPRMLLRVFDIDHNVITSGISGWTYNSFYAAFYLDNDVVEFSLPENAETFMIGFVFSTGTVGDFIDISNITLTELA